MLCAYLRSSSYGTYSFCQAQYWIDYVLGLRATDRADWTIPKPQMKADLGSATHKALELLAHRRVCEQEKKEGFFEEELGRSFLARELTVLNATKAAFTHYQKKLTHWRWDEVEYKQIAGWVQDALDFHGGAYSPLRRNVIWPEKYFDFTIDEPWARYAYDTPAGKVEGQLALKGSIDLVCHVDEDPGCVELVDWKTGSRKNWATGNYKSYEDLRKDPQFRIYHYALSRLLPQAKEVMLTVVYIRDGGPVTLPFYRSDLIDTERMIKARFEEIVQNQKPQFINDFADERWKCNKLCWAGLNKWPGTDSSVCKHLRGELEQLGMERATAKYGKESAAFKYSDGGGQSNREGKKP